MASSNINMLKQTGNNEKSDECYTPIEAIKPLIPFLDKSKIYYDCTSNISSSIVDYLNNNGFKCIPSNGRDFLKDELPDFDIIITNPPYSKKDKFINKCYEIKKPFLLLLPVTSLQGQYRGKLFKKYGIEVFVLNKRIDFTSKGSPHFGVAWFCKDIMKNNLTFN